MAATARRVTSYDVARAAGVAQSTVSRCFDAASGVAQDTRDRVLQVAAGLGYVPNALARSLITRRSNMVGVVATRLTNRANPDVVFALAEALAASGRKMLLFVVDSGDATSGALADAIAYPLDGLIACAALSAGDLERLGARNLPVVFFNHHVEAARVDCVCTDHAAAAREVASALVAAGHGDFLCIGGPERSPVSRQRTRAFLGRLAELGITGVPSAASDYSYDSGRRIILERSRQGRLPKAVFCANDQLAFGVMDALRFELGLGVPEDVSVVGFDDVPDAARPVYALTTVRQELADMARKAVELLGRRQGDPAAPAEIALISGRLIRRGSARLG